jgi:hypothetical protein
VLVGITWFGSYMGFNGVFVANVLLFDTRTVASSFAICNFFARFTTILAPRAALLKPEIVDKLIFICFTAIALVATIFMIDPKKKEVENKDKFKLIKPVEK